jgi:DNA-binding SARP family transcriptional activator/Tfp pilus assembly protein PilF
MALETGGQVPPLAVRVLGQLAVSLGGAPVEIPSVIQRNLLALLALRPDYAAPVDEIAETLWPERLPGSWRNLIQVHVNRLRAIIEPGRARRAPSRVLLSLNGCYRLNLLPGQLDVLGFLEAADEAKRTPSERTFELYEKALACWRGPVLAGADETLRRHPAVLALHRRRVEVATAHAELANVTGRHAQAKRWLRELCDEEPLHESLHAQLMVALAGSGEQAAALDVYTIMRARLAEQLGVDPGPEMYAAYQRVLDMSRVAPRIAAARPADVVPLQVPATVSAFLGRDAELRWLDELTAGVPMAPPIAVICGTAGVGKTALVAHWAHLSASRFPDGQLYADLRGFDSLATPVDPAAVLRSFLRALGVAPVSIPAEMGEAAALYRSLLAGRRMLVVLDNALSVEQVRPLLPGAAGCTALVTSRKQLAGLVAGHGAHSLELDTMHAEHAVALLRLLLGDRAGRTEQTQRLAHHCAYLPLALRIAAANLLCQRYLTVEEVLERMAGGDVLAELSIQDGQRFEVRAAFSLSYNDLAPPARRLFRLLHVIPTSTFGVHAAAALLGEAVTPVLRLLGVLCEGHILTRLSPSRYHLHDLLRQYSHECAAGDETALAARRLVDFYSVTVHEAYPLIGVRRNDVPRVLRHPPVEVPRFADRDAALAWHDQERENLVGMVGLAAGYGWHDAAWQIADSLYAYLSTRRHWPEWQSVLVPGLESARRLGDDRAIARLENALGVVFKQTGRNDEARQQYEIALEHATAVGYHRLIAALNVNLGGLLVNQGEVEAAVRHLRQALADPEYGQHPRFATLTYLNYGNALLELEELDEAARALTRSLELAMLVGDLVSGCYALHNLAEIHLRRGDIDAATRYAHDQLELAVRAGDPLRHACALDILASCLAAEQDRRAARARWSESLEILRSLGHQLQHPLAQWLGEFDDTADLSRADERRRRLARKLI